jgi:hypothetical protein
MRRDGRLRASDADREQVVQRLHAAATEGRLSAEELAERVHRALTALTYGELDAVVEDLPRARPERLPAQSGARRAAGPSGAGPWRRCAPTRCCCS